MADEPIPHPETSGKPSRDCDECGTQFLPKRPSAERFCSKQCRRKAEGREYRFSQERRCTRCGVSFRPKRSSNVTFCSRECAFAYKAALSELKRSSVSLVVHRDICRHCARRFSGKPNSRFCSAECRAQSTRETAQRRWQAQSRRDRSQRACRRCGILFTPAYGDKRSIFCTAACHARHARRLMGGTKHRSRARYHGVEYEPINVDGVFERDGWRCQVCGRKTPKRLRGTLKPNAPELDHRVPMAMGGGHTWANVQCACRACNAAKGGTVARGQMPLFIKGMPGV